MFIFAMCIKMAIDMKVLLLFFVCFMTYSCHSRNHSDSSEVSSVDTLFEVGNSLKLYLSDGVRPTSGYVRYYEENGKSYLVQGNERQKTIRVYDFITGKPIDEVVLNAGEGEFYAHHPDTAFVIGRSKGKASVNAWIKGEKVSLDIPIHVRRGHIEQYPRCWKDGAVHVNGKWYFSCFRMGEYPDEMKSGKERFPLLEVDLDTKNHRFVGAYPDVYVSNNMGTMNYWVPELCRGNNDMILVGFKASPEMLIYSPATGESRFESVKSVYADTIPLPLTEKGRDYFSESDSYYYFAQYSHYGPIYYDPWKKIYYRFVGIGLNDWDLEPSPFLQEQKKWSVMVFDASFRKLGEQFLGDAYHVDFHFVSPDGLFLLNKGKGENVAEYTLFKYNKE